MAIGIYSAVFTERRFDTGWVNPEEFVIPEYRFDAAEGANHRICIGAGQRTGCAPFVNRARHLGRQSLTGTTPPETIAVAFPPGTCGRFTAVCPESRDGGRRARTKAFTEDFLDGKPEAACNFCKKLSVLLNDRFF